MPCSRAGVDGGGDVYGGSVSTAEASLREADSEETRRVLQSHCSARRRLGRIGEGNEELDRGKAEKQKLARCTSSSGYEEVEGQSRIGEGGFKSAF